MRMLASSDINSAAIMHLSPLSTFCPVNSSVLIKPDSHPPQTNQCYVWHFCVHEVQKLPYSFIFTVILLRKIINIMAMDVERRVQWI